MVGAAVLVTLMMVHVAADVAGKYFLNAPIHGTLEIVSIYYMVAIIYLPIAWASHDGDQIKVELFTHRISPRFLSRYDGVVDILFAAFLAVIAWQGATNAVTQTMINETRETAVDLLVVWPSRWFVPVGFGVAALYHVCRGLLRLTERRAPE